MTSPSNSKLKKALSDHKKVIRQLDGRLVEAGWFESNVYAKGPNKGVPVAKVARWNEFGTATIPARPFMRYASEMFSRERVEIQTRIMKKLVYSKITPEQALNQIGLAMVSKIHDSITSGQWADNAESTKARKGHGENNRPLIDSGNMFKTATHKVT